MNDDLLTQLRAVNPLRDNNIRHLDAAACTTLVALCSPEAPGPRRRRARPRVVAAAVTALALGSGAAYAQLRQPVVALPGNDVNCSSTWRGDQLAESGGAPRSGDPVLDCQYYQRLQGRPQIKDPVAFAAQNGLVFVAPRDQVPASGRLLPPVTRDERVGVELQSSMQDFVDGMNSRCLDEAAAIAFGRTELARLGLTRWRIRVVPAAPAYGPCSFGDADIRNHTLGIYPDRGTDWDPAHGQSDVFGWVFDIVHALRDDVAARCLSLDDAEKVTRKAFGQHEMELRLVPDESVGCTRVDASVPGVVLYGPAQARP